MIQRFDTHTRLYINPVYLDPEDEETIELELTPEQQRVLREAAGEAFADEVKPVTPAPAAVSVTPPVASATPVASAAPVIPIASVVSVMPAAPSVMPIASPAQVMPATAPFAKPTMAPEPPRLTLVEPAALVAALMPPASTRTPSSFSAPAPARTPNSVSTPASAGTPSPVTRESSLKSSPLLELVPPSSAAPVAPRAAPVSGSKPRSWSRARLTTLVGMMAIASVALAGVGYFTRPASHAEVAPPPALPAPPAAPTESSEPISLPADEPARSMPVKFTNPFDANEVFEFPPGTSETEARDATAAMLLERARERTRPSQRVSSTNSPHRR